MTAKIVVPELSESVREARIARWLKHEGDPVTAGESLVELETEKSQRRSWGRVGGRPGED